MTKGFYPPENEQKKRSPQIFNRKVFYKGDYIFKQGDDASAAYYIEDGEAEVIMHDDEHETRLGVLKKGDIFGEMSLIDPAKRSAAVRVTEKCTVVILSRNDLESKIDLLENKPVQALFKILIRRLRQSNKEQFKKSKDIAKYKSHLTNIVDGLSEGIPTNSRRDFRKEVMPLLAEVEAIVKRYAYTDEIDDIFID